MLSRVLVGISLLLLSSCLAISQDTGDAGASGSGGSGGSGGSAASAIGTGCGQDPTTGATLCLGVSTCTGLTVDQDKFPNCGFRQPSGTTLDIECSCSGYVCPLGVATSCAEAQTILSERNYLTVCAQVDDGHCTEGSSSGAAGASASKCDKGCELGCANDPLCIQSCGC